MNADVLLETTLAVSASVLVVLMARRPLRAFAGPGAAYAMWALVPAALLAVLLPAAVEPAAPARMVAGMLAFEPIAGAPSSPEAYTPVPWLMSAWAAGALATLAMFAVRQWRFRRALGVLRRRPDGLWQGQGGAGLPAVLGWPARIVLPADFDRRYAPAEQALVLCHERVHLRRGDVPASAVAAALRCLFWFNPLVHVGAGVFRQDQELACDAAVLRQFPGARRTYADALLKTQLADEPLPVGCHWFGSHPLKERVAMLKHPIPGSGRRRAGVVAAALLAIGGAAMAWAAQPAVQQEIPAGKMRLDLTVRIDDGAPMRADAILAPGQPHDFEFRNGDEAWRVQASVLQTQEQGFYLSSRILRDGELVGEPKLLFEESGASVKIGEERPDGSFGGIAIEISVTGGVPATVGETMSAADLEKMLTGSDDVLTPSFDRLVTPPYDPSSLAAGEGGTVWLKVLVAEDGRPLRVEYDAQDSTLAADSPLALASIESMQRSTFLPARKDGRPIEAWMRLPIRFEPED